MAKKKAPAKKAAKKKTGNRQVASTENHELSKSSGVDLEEDAGSGQEDMSSDDYATPRISILQALSPQCKKSEEGYIEGAEEGMICDTVSAALMDGDEGILAVPISYRRTYIEWKLREDGGGFVKDHGLAGATLEATAERDIKGRKVLENGNQIVATAEYFIFIIEEDGTYMPYVLSMKGSQIKKSRRWNTMINQLKVDCAHDHGTFNPAIFYRGYRMTTVPERNDEGSWFGWKIVSEVDTLALPGGESIYLAAREFRKKVTAGEIKAAVPQGDSSDEEESEDAPM